MSLELPEKHFYTMGDVCKLTGTKAHVLRYWESQFKLLRPARRYSGHRKFTRADIDLINRIKFLIIEKKFTLEGAKKEINKQLSPKPQADGASTNAISALPLLQDIKKEVEACLSMLGPVDQIAQVKPKAAAAMPLQDDLFS